VAREPDSRLKLGDFGTFVIFAAVYAAGTLGLPAITFLTYQLKIGEMATPFVAIFGLPAVLGLTLGQFIANLGLQTNPVAMLSPIFSFMGLLVIYYTRKRSTLGGCIAYIMITGIWLSFALPIARPESSSSPAVLSAFADQFIAVMVGYAGYMLATKTMTSPTRRSPELSIGKPSVELDKSDLS
jgi:hypothetical protein